MKILLTNDDGIEGEGLKVLRESLVRVLGSKAEICILAPEHNMSGSSHCIEMNKSLTIKERFDVAPLSYSIDGSPCDCVMTALTSNLFEAACVPIFDLVISGCNKGANMGTDIIYSGTVAGARQGALWGVPSIALSLSSKTDEWNFKSLCDFVADNLDALISLVKGKKDVFLNINAKNIKENEKYLGIEQAFLCKRVYNDIVAIKKIGDGVFKTEFVGCYAKADTEVGSDYDVVKSGKIAISLVKAEYDTVEMGDFDGGNFSFG